MSISNKAMDCNVFKLLQASAEAVDMVIEERDPSPDGISVASTTLTLT